MIFAFDHGPQIWVMTFVFCSFSIKFLKNWGFNFNHSLVPLCVNYNVIVTIVLTRGVHCWTCHQSNECQLASTLLPVWALRCSIGWCWIHQKCRKVSFDMLIVFIFSMCWVLHLIYCTFKSRLYIFLMLSVWMNWISVEYINFDKFGKAKTSYNQIYCKNWFLSEMDLSM